MSSMLNLSIAPVGRKLSVRHLVNSSPELCIRLRELGFCENAVIRCISRNNMSLICEVCNTRIGLNAGVASNIYVSQFE